MASLVVAVCDVTTKTFFHFCSQDIAGGDVGNRPGTKQIGLLRAKVALKVDGLSRTGSPIVLVMSLI